MTWRKKLNVRFPNLQIGGRACCVQVIMILQRDIDRSKVHPKEKETYQREDEPAIG